jgi:hypothetical protein
MDYTPGSVICEAFCGLFQGCPRAANTYGAIFEAKLWLLPLVACPLSYSGAQRPS